MGFAHWFLTLLCPAGDLSAYERKIRSTGPIAYWPQGEKGGTIAKCLMNPAQDGAYSSVALANAPGPDGKTWAPLFDGANSYADIFSPTLAAAFSGAEGSAMVWGRVLNAGIWADGTTDFLFYLYADSTNRVIFQKTVGALAISHIAGGVNRSRSGGTTPTTWFNAGLTWSVAANEVLHYWNGAPIGPVLAPGVWAGALVQGWIGTSTGAPPAAFPWNGWGAHAALWNRPLSGAEMAALANPT